MKRSRTFAALFTVVGVCLAWAAAAQESPESVYRKFHDASIAGNIPELVKWGSADVGKDLARMPKEEQKMLIGFMSMTVKDYTVVGKDISPDGGKATLRLRTKVADKGKVTIHAGTAYLVKEGGAWKVLRSSWGGDQPSNPADNMSALEAMPAQPARYYKEKFTDGLVISDFPSPKSERPAAPKPAPAKPAQEAKRDYDYNRDCFIKPVMTDDEIARCRSAR